MSELRHDGRQGGSRVHDGVALLRIAAVAILLGVTAAPALAQSAGAETDVPSAWNKFLRAFGLQKEPEGNPDIDYTERAPLVVPPSRDLPAPESTPVTPVNWPKDPAKQAKGTKDKTAVVPNTAVQTPNPPHEKKPWYNPSGWFDKEEYASFTGEPVRHDLTDPPAGYRVPSAEQPYGIAPDKKEHKVTGKDLMLGQVNTGSH